MAKIDLGNFGTSVQDVAPAARTDVVGEAVQGLGATIVEIGRQKAEQRFQQQAATASNNLLDHQLQNQQDVQTIQDKLASGEIQPEDARPTYDKLAARNVIPQVDHLTPEAAAAYSRGAQRVQAEGALKIDALTDVARKHRAIDQASQGIDTSLKLAGNPSVTSDQKSAIADQIRSFGPVLRQSGVPQDQVDQRVQGAVDQLWFDDAQQRAIVNHDNMAGLQQLQKDLTSGFYAQGKEPLLDTNKRNAVMAQVTNRIDTIQMRLMHEADKRDADGLRAINEMERQDATGVPAPPEQLANWAQRTQGTSSAADFAEALKQSQETQDLLRLPPAQQLSAIQAEQARQDQQGATVREQQNLARKGNAVVRNITQMQNDPLTWGKNRLGLDVPPLDFSQLMAPNGASLIQGQLSQRALDIATIRKQQGPGVQMRPLLPQEAGQLGAAIASASPDQAAATFAAIQHVSGSPDVYMGIMAQIAPDHPVLALAGRRALQDPQVATYMVQGEALLNPSKAAKAADGKPDLKLYVPDDKAFQQAFTAAVGSSYRGHQGAAETDFQAVKAYYTGRAVHDGTLLGQSTVPDDKLLQESIDKVTGTVVNYNGQGEVQAPWGMDKSTFLKRVDNAWAVLQAKYPEIKGMSGAQLSQIGLTNGDREGQYLIPSGGQYLAIHTGKGQPPQTVVIDVNDPAVVNYLAPGVTFRDPRSGTSATVSQ
jgi:hypothetical protein